MKAAFLAFALLAACGEHSPSSPADGNALSGAPPAANEVGPLETAAAAAKAFSVEEDTDLYGFKYGWSAEAAAIPQLAERFRKEMEKAKAELIEDSKEDRDGRASRGFDYHPHELQQSYETAGQSDRLLSLESGTYGFTGGAHGSTGSSAILWDRSLAREVSISDLLQSGTTWTGAIRQPFCLLLDREREKRRGEPVRKDDMFGKCPGYDEVTVVLRDSDNNSRFDHIGVIADQYVAGPYAEGPYEIALPITAAMIERLKPEYRGSFEPRPPVK